MKSWLHTHSIRKSISEGILPLQRHDSVEVDDTRPPRPLPVIALRVDAAARIAASDTSSRMSIERYLSAPLDDEPASAPAIDRALKKHGPKEHMSHAPGKRRKGHSRDSSYDALSEGQRTCYTSGSAPESTGTSYSAVSRANHHRRSMTQPDLPQVPRIFGLNLGRAATGSPERPTTARTVDTEKSWAPQNDGVTPLYAPHQRQTDYKVKAGVEIVHIQKRAKALQDQLQNRETKNDEPRVTDEMAYAKMVQRPKLAWVLGGEMDDAQSIRRPKSSTASILMESPTDEISRMPNTSWLQEGSQHSTLRKTKSSDTLESKARRANGHQQKTSTSPTRKPKKRPRFYCTFCQKRFPSLTDWMKHEQSVHMPAELWICCPRTGDFPERCPFCAKKDPSPSHLADHNYLACQSKPLSERTFAQQDAFLQHINQEHKVSPDQKPLRLSELLEAWRHPLPLKFGHQALHCGFCGQVFPTYRERTEHVATHFTAGLDMMSWWTGRINQEITGHDGNYASPELPHKCGYCERVYDSLATAQKLHPVCTMWSCSFLPGMQHTIYPAGVQEDLEAVCCYCNESLVRGNGRVKGAVLKEHIAKHNFRNCSQRLYFSGQRFRQHLQDSHRTNNDGTLFAGWTLLVKTCKKSFPTVFYPVNPTKATLRRAFTSPDYTDDTTNTPKSSNRKKAKQSMEAPAPKLNFMDLSSETPNSSPPRKLRKTSIATIRDPDDPEPRTSTTSIFSRTASIDVPRPYRPSSPRSCPLPSSLQHQYPRSTPLDAASPALPPPPQPHESIPDAAHEVPRFYRKKLDASARNRVFVRLEGDTRLGKKSHKAFRKVGGGVFGGLVLRTSLVAGAPVRMMNGVDVYYLH
ncbi:unnamed protein product [Periconia digitata]|uniref:C2H2-type domain-containing protein n=1 Tax=Periconia digitata TaxID=1303443 RepID=A0A9W4XEU4_9PLEO|nr:unnamed protein product [Periconia digitata]